MGLAGKRGMISADTTVPVPYPLAPLAFALLNSKFSPTCESLDGVGVARQPHIVM